MKVKVNDWCFFRFELHQVKEIGENHIELSNGYTRIHGGIYMIDECFPLDLNVKCISGEFHYWYKKLHDIKNVNLNYPDIVRYIENEYKNQCENYLNGKEVTYQGLHEFCKSIIEKSKSLNDLFVNGIKILR